MPTDRETATQQPQPKFDLVRLEDRLNPVGLPTSEQFLTFTPNTTLDFGSTSPTAPVGSDSVTSALGFEATPIASVEPVLAPNSYELTVPTTGDVSPSADSSGGSFALFSVVPPPPAASLSGFVYVDEGANGGTRDDGIKQAGEPGIPGATVTLLRVINGVTITASQTTTDGTGFYQFPNLVPFGEYRLVETQPADYLDGKDTPGTINGLTRGVLGGNDNLSGITLNASETGINYNFGELIPAPPPGALSGFVYVDEGANGGIRDDGVKQTGEPGIPGTTVQLFRIVNGQTVSVGQTTTDASGFYQFTNLTPGEGYIVRESQPGGFVDGKDTPGSTGGTASLNDELRAVTVPAGGESTNNNFGELLPPPPPAQFSGFVYEDNNNDGVKDPSEAGIAGTVVTLTNGTTTLTTTTDGNGFYQFTNLTPGTYTAVESQPANYLDGKDTAGTRGGTVTNDRIASVVLNPNDNSQNNNFGELKPASLSGFEYEDLDDDGVKDPSELGIAGVTMVLTGTDDLGAVTRTAVTSSNGAYSFPDLRPGTYTVSAAQPASYIDGKDTPGSTGGSNAVNDVLSSIPLVAGANSVNNNFGELIPPGTLSGFVYVDEGASGGTRDDGIKQVGEPGIAGTSVTLFRVLGGVTTSLAQTTTDATGFYQFTGLTPGSGYLVRETQPPTFLDGKDTPGSTGGSAAVNDELSGITIPPGGTSQNNNFGELVQPAQLSGFVYLDNSNDGIKDPNEAGLPGVTVTLFRLINGQATSVAQTLTNGAGFYQFTALPAGTYEVRETHPIDYLDGKDTPGSTGGSNATNDVLSAIVLNLGDNSVNNNFGELLPARLSGFEYVDEGANGGTRDDGIKQAGEPGIPGVIITLTGTDDLGAGVTRTTTTGSDGGYSFGNLRPGTYAVSAAQPSAFVDGKDAAGTVNGGVRGTAGNDTITGITLNANDNSVQNNFGELLPAGTLSGFVYEDTNDDGVKDPGEAGITGVNLTLVRVVNGVTTTLGQTTTDSSGAYQFTGLTPGDGYRVVETQPSTYQDGKDTPGSTGGSNATNDVLDAISIPSNGASVNNNFGERLGQLSGFVYVDEGANGGVRDDGVKQAGEPGIAGTTVTLYRVVGGQATSVTQATTDAAGFYQFTRLAPGSYQVRETQPAGYVDGKDTPGAGNGASTTANDVITTVGIGGAFDLDAPNNNFGELLPPPPPLAQLSGFVYVDEGGGGAVRNDGIKQPGEPGIGGVAVTLFRTDLGGATAVAQALTDSTGFYSFTNLPAGTYEVRETQPASFLDGKDTPGSTGGSNVANDVLASIPLAAGANSVNNNFGELVPPVPPIPGALNGFVYVDSNDNGVKDTGEAGIPGTTVRLTNGTITLTTTTDGNGFYQFTNLTPGTYTVLESQPAGYLDGQDTPGSTGGNNTVNDVLSVVSVPAGVTSVNNNFGELRPVSLYGYVWYDANRSGTFDPSEIGLGGATVTLTGTTLSGLPVTTAVTTTDAFGRYSFTALPPGVYSVVQSNTPSGYEDFKEENAARLTITGGSSSLSFNTFVLTRDAGPLNFGKVNGSIVVPPPPPNPQFPDPSKQNFLGSTGSSGVTVPPTTPGQQLPIEAGPFNPAILQSGTRLRAYAIGSAAGAAAVVRVMDANTGGELFRLRPFEDAFLGGVTTAVGDLNGDGVADILAAAGSGGGPRVKAYDGQTGAVMYDFYAYDQSFNGGVWVASGDVDGDGYGDIVTGAGAGGGPHVKAFSGRTGEMIQSFYAFDAGYTGGARVAVGDFNGDGRADIAASTGAATASQIITYDARSLAVLNRLQPFESAFVGGVNLAAGDVNGDGRADLIAGAASGGGPRVKVMDANTGASLYDFYAYEDSFTGGVSVAARDLDGDGRVEVITGSGAGQQSRVQILSGANLSPLDSLFAFESTNKNGVFVG